MKHKIIHQQKRQRYEKDVFTVSHDADDGNNSFCPILSRRQAHPSE
jgi:hypothetical protein